MNFTNFIGIDISKNTLDICLLDADGVLFKMAIENETLAISQALKNLFLKHQLSVSNTLICAEHTGHYANILANVMNDEKYNFWLADPYTIKHSQGIKRGKSDVIDAERIAIFAKRNQEDKVLTNSNNTIYKTLAYLRSQREILVGDCAKYKAQLKDEKAFYSLELYNIKKLRYEPIIAILKEKIKEIEAEIDALIEEDKQLKSQFEIIVSVDGVGPQIALETIITTEGFTKFSSARAFACHAGCAPFRYESGTSIRSKNRVSFRSNKKLKSLFHMGAVSCIRMKEGELKDYYERRLAEGKNEMCILNAMRSKLIHRIFALVHSGKKYEKKYQHPLQKP